MVLALGLISCSYSSQGPGILETGQRDGSASAAAPLATEVALLQVFLPGGRSVPFTLRELRILPQATLDIPGGQLSGPPLMEVLEATGVGEFRTVTLVGKGSISLANTDLSPEVILRLTSHGTLDLAGENIPRAEWVRDVHEIRVR